jgi:hypothetical protein
MEHAQDPRDEGREDDRTTLTERVTHLTDARDRWKAYNDSCKEDKRNTHLLSKDQQAELVSIMRVMPTAIGKRGEAPTYLLSNLSTRIRRDEQRLGELTKAQRVELPEQGRGGFSW